MCVRIMDLDWTLLLGLDIAAQWPLGLTGAHPVPNKTQDQMPEVPDLGGVTTFSAWLAATSLL